MYTLSLHAALPICRVDGFLDCQGAAGRRDPDRLGLRGRRQHAHAGEDRRERSCEPEGGPRAFLLCHVVRSEEHTSELQSRFALVCRLLLEKKKHDRTCGRQPSHRLRPALPSLMFMCSPKPISPSVARHSTITRSTALEGRIRISSSPSPSW